MRELKFKCWNKKTKTMFLVFDLFTEQVLFNKSEDILMQYTGLKDKNGKEIYEGDILNWIDSGDVMEVKWIDASWQVFGSFNNFSNHNWKNSEVIGNIYENPKLNK